MADGKQGTKRKTKRMSRSQVSAVERSGATVKREASVIKIDGMDNFMAVLKTVQQQQKQVIDLLGQTMASVLNNEGSGGPAMAKAVDRLAAAVEAMGRRPKYEFEAVRTADGFKIDATPKLQKVTIQ